VTAGTLDPARVPPTLDAGAATLIATDQSGTLTVNRLRVAATGPLAGSEVADVLEAGMLASDAELVDGDDGSRVAGNPSRSAPSRSASSSSAPSRRLPPRRSCSSRR
jgi:magnesium-transporting ATPase (P-type)